jgi:hypothetical protein
MCDSGFSLFVLLLNVFGDALSYPALLARSAFVCESVIAFTNICAT